MSAQGFAVMKQTIQARVINAMKIWTEISVDFKGKSLITSPQCHYSAVQTMLFSKTSCWGLLGMCWY